MSPAALPPTRFSGPESPSYRTARDAAAAPEPAIAIRPLEDEQGRILGLLAIDTAKVDLRAPQILGWWFSPTTPGRWAEVRAGRWNGPTEWHVAWREPKWSDFFRVTAGRPFVAEGMRNHKRPLQTLLGQAGASGALHEGDTPERVFFRRPLVDLHETAEAIAERGGPRPDRLTLEELARLTGIGRVGRDDRERLVAAALVWARYLAPAMHQLAEHEAASAALPPAPPAPVYWPQRVSPSASLRGPIRALGIWLPHGEMSRSVELPMGDLRVIAGPSGFIELRGASRAGDLTIGMKRADARHLVDLLGVAWPLDDTVRQRAAIRIEAYLRAPGAGFGLPADGGAPVAAALSPRIIMLTFESDPGEPILPPGEALRIETGPLGSDPTEGFELLVPIPDGGPLRLRAALTDALATGGPAADAIDRPLTTRLALARQR